MIEIIITVIVAGLVVLLVKQFLTNPASEVASYSPKGAKSTAASGGVGKGSAEKPLILFGTQTGTAEMFAKTLVREGQQMYDLKFRMVDVEDYDMNDLADEKVVIFIVATYGEGEPTDSAKPMHDFLIDENCRYTEEFNKVKFCVFGLGDRQYTKYCQMAYDVDTLLTRYGAKSFYEVGTGDAGRGLEEEWDTWRAELWPAIAQATGNPLKERGDQPIVPELKMMPLPGIAPSTTPFLPIPCGLEPTQKQPSKAVVEENKELLQNVTDGRSTRHIVLDTSASSVTYQAGDHLGVLCCNPDAIVTEAIKVLGLTKEEAEQTFALVDHRKKNQLPAKVAVKTALKWYADLCGAPKKSALRAFTHYCTDAAEKEAFQALLQLSPQGKVAYEGAVRTARTGLGFLRMFPSCKVPIGHFFELMPRIAPRYFSIASDSLRYPTKIFFTVALVDNGLCTQMLGKSGVGAEIFIFVRKSTFHLPMRAKDRPLIMIGPGTGVAPLAGFCHRRLEWQARKQEIGPCMFFFGCRDRKQDYIYQDLLEECHETGVISDLSVAFSREKTEKRYVQHELADRAAQVWALLEQGANVYICGDAKHMAKDVEATLKRIIAEQGGKSEEETETFLKTMTAGERYLKDVWSA